MRTSNQLIANRHSRDLHILRLAWVWFPGHSAWFPATSKTQSQFPVYKAFASEVKIYRKRPPDGVLVLHKLSSAHFVLLLKADIMTLLWEEPSIPGKMVGPEEPQVSILFNQSDKTPGS